MQIAAAGNDADFILLIADQRQIERPAAEIDDQDRLRRRQLGKPNSFGPEHEAEGCCDGFVDDVNVLESRPLARFGGGLSLHVTELGRNRDDRPLDVADSLARTVEHRLQNEHADIDGRITLAANFPAVIGIAHIPLRVDDDFVGMPDRIAKCLGPDNDVVAIEQHHGGSRKFTVLVGDCDRFAVFVEVRETRVGRSQVDANGVCRKHGALALEGGRRMGCDVLRARADAINTLWRLPRVGLARLVSIGATVEGAGDWLQARKTPCVGRSLEVRLTKLSRTSSAKWRPQSVNGQFENVAHAPFSTGGLRTVPIW